MRVPDLPYRPTIPVVLRRASEKFGDGDYIVMPDRLLTFGDAEQASRQLAKQLLARSVGKGTRVGIHLATGPDWAIAFLAVARIGAIAMPFSTIYRPAELRRALRVGDVAVLLSSAELMGKDHEAFLEEAIDGLVESEPGRLRTPELPYLRSVVLLSETSRTWAERPIFTAEIAREVDEGDRLLEAVEDEVWPADLLTAVFTSGTTADPKAVLHTHGAAVRKTAPSVGHSLEGSFPGRVLNYMPFFWVGGMQNVLGALQSGAALLTLERLHGPTAVDLAEREKATSFSGNATTLKSAFAATNRSLDSLPSLRALPKRPWEGPPSAHGDAPTGLGMTETIGPWAGIPDFDVKVVDPETGRDAKPGEEGEFWIRGYSLTPGLYKKEREEVFTPDGYYRTGDIGYAENGLVYFRGRRTDMIKTRGANVAPAEVEMVLMGVPDVKAAIVVGLPHEEFGQEVAAVVVTREGNSLDIDALRGHLARELSPYKVPTVIREITEGELPYLPSSKVNRRELVNQLARWKTSA